MMASAGGAAWVWDGAGAKLGLKLGLERQRTGLGCQCDERVTRGDCRTDGGGMEISRSSGLWIAGRVRNWTWRYTSRVSRLKLIPKSRYGRTSTWENPPATMIG